MNKIDHDFFKLSFIVNFKQTIILIPINLNFNNPKIDQIRFFYADF
jgi:hypothetical protein